MPSAFVVPSADPCTSHLLLRCAPVLDAFLRTDMAEKMSATI